MRGFMTISDWRLPQKAAWWDKLVRFLPWVLALGMAAKAVRHVYEPLLKPLFLGEYVGDLWIYTAAQNQLNWFTTGLMRRELYNTFVGLAGLMGADAMISNAVVFLIFYFMLAAALIWAVARRKGSVHLIALAAMSVVIFYRLSFDVGRSDVAVMLCGLLAAWAARSGRWAVSAAAVSIALAIHETGMIFLAPVVCAIVWEKQAWRDIDWRSIGAAAAVMAVGLGFYVLCSRAQVDVHAAAMHVHTQFAHFEALNWADLASYFNLISFRTIETTWCEIPKNPQVRIAGSGRRLPADAAVCHPAAQAVAGDADLRADPVPVHQRRRHRCRPLGGAGRRLDPDPGPDPAAGGGPFLLDLHRDRAARLPVDDQGAGLRRRRGLADPQDQLSAALSGLLHAARRHSAGYLRSGLEGPAEPAQGRRPALRHGSVHQGSLTARHAARF
jgi:hypothetical protein